ncbi:MMPL family transporter [Mobilicoccus massiliensis]|uniref:MMPL family transporter n=1 Tax=Mobilicoccus massiliensis TaxID=1522310 RepID=UPI0006942BEB|nr:MMPL family transporter [Mobilicoccus massiliensis]
MSSSLFDLGSYCHRHAKQVLGVWFVLLILLGAGMGLLSKGTSEVYTVPGSQGQEAIDDLEGRFPELSGAGAQVVVQVPEGRTAADERTRHDVAALVQRLERIDGVSEVADPYDENVAVSDDRRAVLVEAQLDAQATDVDEATRQKLLNSVDPLRRAGYVAEVGGGVFMLPPPTISWMEAVGLGIAMFVLYLTFRSVRAAALPVVSALAGAGTTACLVMIATSVAKIPGTAPLLALMIGIAVGIDYALFILARHREQLADGLDLEESVALSNATAGGAVVFAGLTVLIALLGLGLAGLPFLTAMGIAGSCGVAVAVLASITLLPALMSLLGERLAPRTRGRGRLREDDRRSRDAVARAGADAQEPSREGDVHTQTDQPEHDDEHDDEPESGPGADGESAAHEPGRRTNADDDTGPGASARRRTGGWAGAWARTVTAVPALTLVVVTAGLVALAVPALGLRLALPDNGSIPTTESPRRAYDLIGEHFGPGANGPLLVTADIIGSDDPVGLVDDLEREIAAVSGIERISLATPNRDADTGVIVAVPETGPMDARTADLVRDLRGRLPGLGEKYDTTLAVTGHTAIQIDVSDRLGKAVLPFAAVVMGLSLLLLTIVFRSLLVPLTATIGFVLSTTAAFGVITLVFEHGWLADMLGVTRLGPVISFMPIIVMGVLFGLAMDYQVFLVSRMREAYVRGASPKAAVVDGFVSSGPVVAAAAAIMVAVFASFVPHADANLKPIAAGLAIGVLLDAVVIRMIFIPAALTLCGRHTWMIPAALDRILPHVDVEGGIVHDHLERSRQIREHPRRVVEARDVDIRGARGPVVTGLDLHVDEPGVCIVQGPDGTGKTSVLLTLAGRMPFESGCIEIAGYVLPEQAAAVQRRVALAEMRNVNDLDNSLKLGDHIAERLSARTLMPWARSRDVERVMDQYTAALVAAKGVKGSSVPRTEIDPRWVVGDLNGVERELFGIVLALVERPRVLVIDENGELRSDADRLAVMTAVGHLLRTEREAGRVVSVIGATTAPVDPAAPARLAGVPLENVSIVTLDLGHRSSFTVAGAGPGEAIDDRPAGGGRGDHAHHGDDGGRDGGSDDHHADDHHADRDGHDGHDGHVGYDGDDGYGDDGHDDHDGYAKVTR